MLLPWTHRSVWRRTVSSSPPFAEVGMCPISGRQWHCCPTLYNEQSSSPVLKRNEKIWTVNIQRLNYPSDIYYSSWLVKLSSEKTWHSLNDNYFGVEKELLHECRCLYTSQVATQWVRWLGWFDVLIAKNTDVMLSTWAKPPGFMYRCLFECPSGFVHSYYYTHLLLDPPTTTSSISSTSYCCVGTFEGCHRELLVYPY